MSYHLNMVYIIQGISIYYSFTPSSSTHTQYPDPAKQTNLMSKHILFTLSLKHKINSDSRCVNLEFITSRLFEIPEQSNEFSFFFAKE